MLASLVLGVSCLLSGLAVRGCARVLGAADEAHVTRARTLEGAKSFDEAASGADVVVSGTAGAGPAGPTVAPISGTQAAWLRVETTEERSTDPKTSFESISTIRAGQAFEVVLPSGARVPVRLGDKDVEGLSHKNTGPVVRPSAALAAYLEARGAAAPSTDDFVRRREYVETALPLGHRIFVLGVKRGGGGGSTASAYRGAGEDAWVEPTLAHVALDEDSIRELAKPEAPGIGVVLGWLVAIGGPAAALVLGVNGAEPEVVAAIFAPPAGTFGLWLALGLVKLMVT